MLLALKNFLFCDKDAKLKDKRYVSFQALTLG